MNASPLLNPPNLAAPAPVSATLRCAPQGVATPTAKKVARRRKLARADWLDLFQHLQALKIMPKAEFLSEPYFSIDAMVLAISEESYQISAGTKNGAFERVSVEFASIQDDSYPKSYVSIHWEDRIYFRMELAGHRRTFRLRWIFNDKYRGAPLPWSRIEFVDIGPHTSRVNRLPIADARAIEELDRLDVPSQTQVSLENIVAESRPDLVTPARMASDKRIKV